MGLMVALVLVGCAGRTEPAPVRTIYTGKSIYDYERASLATSAYEVKAGETLYSIAFRANKDVRELAALNNISAPYTIYPGQSLRIESSSAISASPPKKPANSSSKQASSPVKAKPVARQPKPVAESQKKEYVENVAKKQRPIERPKTSVEPQLSNAEIAWQWPSKGPVIGDFSLQQAGNKGLDFGGERGDPVQAAAAGKVVYVGNALRGFGRLIILKHNDDFITAYAHNDELLVKEQDWVTKGQEIALMGSSDSDRVKLHFEVRFRGKSVNPRHYLPK